MIIPRAFNMPTKSLPKPDTIIRTRHSKVGRWMPDGWLVTADHTGVELLAHAGSSSLKSGSCIDAPALTAALAAAHQWHQHSLWAIENKNKGIQL